MAQAVKATFDLSYKDQPDAQNLDHIPGEYGMPVLGKTYEILTDLHALVHEHYVRFGEVSRVNLGGQRGLLVMGPENLKQIYLDPERNFSTEMGYAERLGRFYKGGLLLRDFDEHRMQRRIFQSAFKNNAMKGYVDVINPLFKKYIAEWSPYEFTFFPHIKKSLLRSVAKVFIDLDDIGPEAEKLNDAFIATTDGLTAIVRKDIPLPWLKYHKGQQGKRFIHDYVKSLIEMKRKEPGSDILSFMCHEKTEEGDLFSYDDIVQHVSFLLFGAHDTTTSALTHMVYRLAVHQDWQEKLRDACVSMGKEFMDYDDINNMQILDDIFHETLRLHPSVELMTRRTVRECEIGGHRVPANTMIFIPPCYNHKMDKYWKDPEKFDPDRFSPERSEQKGHPFLYVPFGGGPHKCIGMHFAAMQAKLFMFQFVQKYRFRAPDNYYPKLQHVPMPKPADDLPLVLEKIQ
ncbi:MAG: cytochrome P450 [Pseudomonadales bacterium]|nr:cytochrome P450 [Pseudomonadales bacterium]